MSNLSANVSVIISPVIGGAIYDMVDYSTAMIVCAGFCVFSMLVALFNCGCSPFAERAREVEELKKLIWVPPQKNDLEDKHDKKEDLASM